MLDLDQVAVALDRARTMLRASSAASVAKQFYLHPSAPFLEILPSVDREIELALRLIRQDEKLNPGS